MSLGVYIHFPYCSRRCGYCDFAIHVRRSIPHQRYADAVLAELHARAPLFEGRDLVSIYFGGGTPGLWDPVALGRVLAGVRQRFSTSPIEVTVEANPGDLASGALARLRAAGVNRISLGVQSLAPRQLALLGREHLAADAERAVAEARAAGIENLSLDLLFALPGQTLGDLDRDLAGLLALAPDHLSIYNLTVEERTPFGALQRAGTLGTPVMEVQAEMFERIERRARAAGFDHYEISSYARPGHRAIHNQLYWSGGEWLGLGSSAHSFRRLSDGSGERFATVRSVDHYFARIESVAALPSQDDPLLVQHERLDAAALAREALWLGLRLLDSGIDRAQFVARFGFDPVTRFASEFGRLCDEGLVEIDDARARLTARGALFADEAGARFV